MIEESGLFCPDNAERLKQREMLKDF